MTVLDGVKGGHALKCFGCRIDEVLKQSRGRVNALGDLSEGVHEPKVGSSGRWTLIFRQTAVPEGELICQEHDLARVVVNHD